MSPTKTAARPALSREVVADRAVALADSEGLDAVTIRRLATELGVTPMALYWHFRTKEDLLAGLGDRVLDGVEIPERTGEWDTDLRAGLVALLVAMRPHPALAELVANQVMLHPKGLALTELALATLSDAGLEPEPAAWFAMQALRTVLALVTGDPVVDSEMSEAARETHQRTKMARIASLSPKEFPALTAHAEAMAYCSDVDLFIDLGVDHYIEGVRGLASRA
ncbi:TetR/AcrR family transcriptional regulator [Jatrophihabitans sp. YIM 134969]